ncbi:MAG: glycyl radical protein [Clostridiales bacterium]|jgi:formate C-acetyltransferase|nr:glycyl radical protein [Clostridiales bacterium]
MNDRVAKLRQQSMDAIPGISTERAELMTAFYKTDRTASIPVKRALAFRYILENKEIVIQDGELIVGERGPVPKAVYTYPEICSHTQLDLEILDTREKIPFAVSEEARAVYRKEVEPYWQGRTMRELIFTHMTKEWKDAYEAGIFTEFMEQRAPGHTVLDDKIYRRGFVDFIDDIEKSLKSLDYLNDPSAYNKQGELTAMKICAESIITFANRYSQKARELSKQESDAQRKAELQKIADVCAHVPAYAPRDLWEAIQSYWFVHLGVIIELNPWDALSPGRLDQHLYPFYKKGTEEGTLTDEGTRELLQCFWIKFNNHPAPPKVGVTAAESGTYTDFANINTGGLKPDGSDGVNDVTYIILDVIDEMRLLQPSTNIQLSKKNPDAFIKRAGRIIRKGWGQPSVFNADMIVKELLTQGKSVVDARNGGASGCVETGAFGKESYILTGYFNLVKVLEITLHNGIDPRTGKVIGLPTGEPREFRSFAELFEAYKKQLTHFIDIKMRGNNVIERLYAQYLPVPFLSVVIDDCIKNGTDYNNGGARYNTNYIQGVGIGSLTDSMAAINYHVFEHKTLTMDDLLADLENNFEGNEKIRQLLLNKTPKYGNDDDYADEFLKLVYDAYYQSVNGRPNTKGGVYRINLLPTTCHVYFGTVVGATPDGRRRGEPLSEGMSPVQGADKKGPTAVIKSAGKIDQVLTGGTLLNQKFTPKILEGEEGINNLSHLVRAYFKLDGHHIQFNVVDKETLLAAQAEPEKYAGLIVRVAGYSDYFNDLSKALQDEIIARTEHQSF